VLQELRVRDFAIIEDIQIGFRPGLNILSGETGAGKSILLKSLALLMGDKADATAVRTGAEQAVVEGSFDLQSRPDVRKRLESMGIESPDSIMVVRRVVGASSKARVYINGALSTLSALREVVSPLVEVTGQAVPLIEMTGQHDNRHLLSRAYHLELLDQYAGTTALRQEHATLWRERQELRREIDEILASERERAQRLDFLMFQRDEILACELTPGAEVEIESASKRIKHAARLTEFVQMFESAIESDDDNVSVRLTRLISRAHELRGLDPSLPDRVAGLESALSQILDVAAELRDYASSLDLDAEALDRAEERLSRLRQLQKKFGSTAEEILAALEQMQLEIGELESSDLRLKSLTDREHQLERQRSELAEELHRRRVEAAQLFARETNAELSELNMKGLEFVVEISASDEASPSGISAVEFMTKTSSQEPPRALAKTASGGELSRILLAIKQVVGVGQYPRTYLFDEVDTGVSGETAEKVGRRLRSIAGGQQVIGVTHLPQVAAMGEAHFFIAKDLSDSSPGAKASATSVARTRVTELDGQARIREIARLISGEKLNSTSMAHAQTLLSDAARIKLNSTAEEADRVGKNLPRSAGQKPVDKSRPTSLSTKDSMAKSPKSRRDVDRKAASKKPTASR